MKLFKYEDYNVTISEEALLLVPFKVIWNRDRSQKKEKALQELGFIYFFCDPRSDYMYIIDEDLRKQNIKEQEGLPNNWEPDKHIEKAILLYKELTQTSASLLLESTRKLVDKLKNQLETIDLTEEDDKGKPKYTLNIITSTIKQIPELAQKIIEAEQAVAKELTDNSRMRGQGVKKLFEDGF